MTSSRDEGLAFRGVAGESRAELPKSSPGPGLEVDSSELSTHAEAILRTLGYMRSNLADPIDVAGLADLALMSQFHFLRTFREVTGVTPGQFLAALRVAAAKRMLIACDHPILDVCFEVGYTSLGSFTTRFTRMVGLAPGRFRQLGRAFYADLEAMLEVVASCPVPDGCQVLDADVERSPRDRVVFAGLFDVPVPQGRPLSCAVVLDSDASHFRLALPNEGTVFLFAVAMSAESSPLDILIGGEAVTGVAGSGPLEIGDDPIPRQSLHLHPRRPFDPPILLALPLLLHEKAAELGHVDDIEHE